MADRQETATPRGFEALRAYVAKRKANLNHLMTLNPTHPWGPIWSGKAQEWEDLEASGLLDGDPNSIKALTLADFIAGAVEVLTATPHWLSIGAIENTAEFRMGREQWEELREALKDYRGTRSRGDSNEEK